MNNTRGLCLVIAAGLIGCGPLEGGEGGEGGSGNGAGGGAGTGGTAGSGGGGTGGAAGPQLRFRVAVDPDAPRLNNLGEPATMPVGHAAQDPTFHHVGMHYFELAPTATTLLGQGEVIYMTPLTSAGGAQAINFAESPVVQPGEIILSLPLSDVTPGTYQYLRVSVSYQHYEVSLRSNGFDLNGHLASFVGTLLYLTDIDVNGEMVAVNANKAQGFWIFDTDFSTAIQGQAPAGATTVPNPLWQSSPIPQGSCVVTAAFAAPLVLTGSETSDVTVNITLSTNQSFEWVDTQADGLWEPAAGEDVVDMGLRGMSLTVD